MAANSGSEAPDLAHGRADKGNTRVCVAAIAGAHGVRGLVKLKCFTQVPEDVAAYGPLADESGARQYAVTLKGSAKGVLLAQLSGIGSREEADALKGLRLYVDRSLLPGVAEEDAFYHADLIGLAVHEQDGPLIGKVSAVHDFGAGPLLDVRLIAADKTSVLVPFTQAVVPVVDIAGGRLVIDPPEGLFDREVKPADGAADA